MAIDKKLIHFKTRNNFILQGVGSEENITTPTSGKEDDGTAIYGQIKGTSIVFIKDSQEIWTHGQLYSCSDPDLSNFVTKEELEELEKLSAPMISVTYNELKTLRDNSQLIPGQQYRITDYVTTTSQADTQSAGHPFDVIVTADSENTLNEEARACIHEGDTYFSDAGAKLEAWKIWYCLDNDLTRFAWADDQNGKGVIYRMIDEWNNDVPYDFKNIQFKRNLTFENGYAEYSEDGEETWVYTFAGQSYHINNDEWSDMLDGSLESPLGHMSDENTSTFHDNVIKSYMLLFDSENEDNSICGKAYLNEIVFLGYWEEIGSANEEDMPYYYAYCCHGNTFGNYCRYNSFGNGCYSNSFGNYCRYNSFGNYCRYNSFGDDFEFNSFGNGCYSNSFGNYCDYNSFGNSCYSNSFGDGCYSNSFGDDFEFNSFGDGCYENSFGNYCRYNSFDNYCRYNSFRTFGSKNSALISYCEHNHFDDGCRYNVIWNSDTTGPANALQNININRGVSGTATNYNFINIDTLNAGYEIQVAKNSKGEIKIYCEADLIA